jgi:3-hydroxyacyl-CoA dehydrogenase
MHICRKVIEQHSLLQEDTMQRRINQAGVIGSGIMGGGIAAHLASAGIPTILLDIVPLDLPEAESNDPTARNRIVKSGLDTVLMAQPPLFMHPDDVRRITIGNLEDDIEKLSTCDWIVEVIIEDLNIKKKLLKEIEPIRKTDAIVSTNTSGIPLKSLAEGLSPEFRHHFMGTHFFNPVRYMKLLELIPGPDTLPEVLTFMAEFGARRLGKGIVWAKDTPNFVGNRIGVQGILKAMHLMQEADLTVTEVDALFGSLMGRPKTAMFKTIDLVGLDTLAHVARNTYDLVPEDEERDSFVLPDFVATMLDKKLLGKKSQAGFYKTELTPEWKKIRKAINLKTFEYEKVNKPNYACLEEAGKAKSLEEKMKAIVYGRDPGAQFAWQLVANGLIYAANRIPEIADNIVEIDHAMNWGYNFEMGPFETWDAIGLKASVEKMRQEGMPVPEPIALMVEKGNDAFYKWKNGTWVFYDFETGSYQPVPIDSELVVLDTLRNNDQVVKSCPSASLIDLDDGIFCLEFHTKMNTLNREIVEFMVEGKRYVEENGVGLVIGNQAGGMPGAFSAGGDLGYMASLAKTGNFKEMNDFLIMAQQGLQGLRYANFPVVAAPFGITLGGGCEVSLAVDRIVAHAELYMGLVEIGVGLLPAGSGCLNLWKRFVQTIPVPVTDIDLTKYFVPVFRAIGLAQVSKSAADARASGFLLPSDRIVLNRDRLITEAKLEVLKMLAEGYVAPVKQRITVCGEAAQGMINAELYNLHQAKFISDYDLFLARRIGYVLSGGDVRVNSEIDEDILLQLEREAFVDFWKEEKTQARVAHMLKTGKPLRN